MTIHMPLRHEIVQALRGALGSVRAAWTVCVVFAKVDAGYENRFAVDIGMVLVQKNQRLVLEPQHRAYHLHYRIHLGA